MSTCAEKRLSPVQIVTRKKRSMNSGSLRIGTHGIQRTEESDYTHPPPYLGWVPLSERVPAFVNVFYLDIMFELHNNTFE
jgi:hypothetical protein